jgi:hypothetical protein
MPNELEEVETRADCRLVRRSLESLRSSGYRSLRNLHCVLVGDTLVVSGQVRSYYLKQVAQTILLQTLKVKAVHNLVEVRDENSHRPLDGGIT